MSSSPPSQQQQQQKQHQYQGGHFDPEDLPRISVILPWIHLTAHSDTIEGVAGFYMTVFEGPSKVPEELVEKYTELRLIKELMFLKRDLSKPGQTSWNVPIMLMEKIRTELLPEPVFGWLVDAMRSNSKRRAENKVGLKIETACHTTVNYLLRQILKATGNLTHHGVNMMTAFSPVEPFLPLEENDDVTVGQDAASH